MPGPQRVIQFEYQQNLAFASDQPGWSEELIISVRILSEAITSGWYAKSFGKHGLDFVVLIAIAMHSRPLVGDDLELLTRLGLATKSDEGRLYSRVSDKGLAAELGIDRDTVGACATRLGQGKFITIATLPDGTMLRDSRGEFAGSKVFLVSGELQELLQKGISHRAENFRTVTDLTADGAENFRTVETDDSPHRAENFGQKREKPRTNIDDVDSAEGEVNGGAAAAPLSDRIFAFFAGCKGLATYEPSPKERAALDSLLLDGFTYEQIIAAIESAFERPTKPRYFTLCANIARDQARTPAGTPQPESRVSNARQSVTDQPAARRGARQEPDELHVEPELAQAVEIYCSGGRPLTEDVLARLRRMAYRCSQAAQANGETGAAWVAEALELAQGNADPKSLLNYADKVLKGWIKSGRSDGHKKVDERDVALTPELVIFQAATGRLPLRDQRAIVTRAIQEHGFTADALRPFWEAHVARDKKRSDLTWLLEWAVKGAIPIAGPGRTSGMDQMAQTLQILAQKGE